MSLTVTSLASGSSGNAFLVQTANQALLVEAGLAARTIERHLRLRGVEPAALSGIVVSHEHHDHAHGAGPLARRYGIPLICSPGTAEAMAGDWKGLEVRPLTANGSTVGEVDLWGIPLPHDALAPKGIVLRYAGFTVGWALDLGHVPDHLAAALAETDLVVVEANHDREKLITRAPYSWPIKNRILSPYGHLSNSQAAELLAEVGADGRRRTVWLAHLSERANDHPQGVLRFMENYLNMAGIRGLKLAVAERNRPSVAWHSGATLQQGLLFEP